MGTDPQKFLTEVTQALEAGTNGIQGVAGGENFESNTTEDSEVIAVTPQTKRGSRTVDVYNFAIARVHYQGLGPDAAHVRVFFRLFAANNTNTSFQPDTTYSRYPAVYPVPAVDYGEPTTPVPGVIAGEYVAIPCFASLRANPSQAGAPNTLPSLQLQQQLDAFNDRTLAPTGGPRRDTFYGCFLDINQSAGVLPKGGMAPAGNADGPWPTSSGVTLEPLEASFIRNAHQCIVAEIAFDPDPITTGTEPFNSDKLAQRNISWSYVANPGTVASRQALETFEVRPTPRTAAVSSYPDELLIDWTNIPAGQEVEIYLPGVDAEEVLATASELYPTHRLVRVDGHTLGCLTGGVTYIPLPPGTGDGANFAGLMAIALPEGIRHGQLYTAVVQQLTNAATQDVEERERISVADVAETVPLHWRRVLGTFQINIPVSTKSALLEKEEVLLSIFRWVGESIPVHSRWHSVFERYLRLLARKVSGLGGDPSHIKPAANGYDGLPGDKRHHRGPTSHFDATEVTGKVIALAYDHFGDFEGFILELYDGGIRRFNSREGDIETLVREAWEDRHVTTIIESRDDPCLPVAVILRRSTALDDRRRWR